MILPEITDEDKQFLHYNPNTSDIIEWVQNYAANAVLIERMNQQFVNAVMKWRDAK